MKMFAMVMCGVLMLGAGCTSADDTAIVPSDTAEEAVANDSEVKSPPTGTGTQPDVYNHETRLGRSADGESWTLDDDALIEHASVPNITRFATAIGDFPADTLMVVYVDATEVADSENGTERTGRYVSYDDGATWNDIGPATYVGAEGHVPVDPNLVQLPDGTLRMYYFDFSQTVGGVVLAEEGGASHFYAADSTDGETFTVVGEVFTKTRITDPEVVYYGGQYYMFYAWHDGSDSGIGAAVSDDGLSFEEVEIGGEPRGIPGVMIADGQFQLFGCSSKGIVRYTADTSLSFGEAQTLGTDFTTGGLCDPDPVLLEDGSYLIVIKKAPPSTPRN